MRDIATGMYVAAMSDPARVLRGVAVHREIIADHSVNPDVGCITHFQT